MIVLVIGATGVFGSRLVERLALTTDATILVAARTQASVNALIQRLSTKSLRGALRPCVVDRAQVTAAWLREAGVGIVVDAAGPFQGQDLQLPRAAIEAGSHFIDLADARDYVAEFPQLDESAQRAGVLAVCGASSTPAISNAALDELSMQLPSISEVDVYISPGNRAPRGVSVVRAILSYVGRPVRVLEEGRWRNRAGWSMLHRRSLEGLARRWFSLCETPDLDLMPARYASVRRASFYAGLELGLLQCGLWLLSWLVRLRLVRSLESWSLPMHWMADRFARFGTDRGGMLVEAIGSDRHGRRATAQWGLVAEAGHGPFVPTLPAVALIRKLLAREVPCVGARACVGLLTLTEIEREFSGLQIASYRSPTRELSLFRKVLDTKFDLLPRAVQVLHELRESTTFKGTAEVVGASTRIGRLLAYVFGFPSTLSSCAVTVTMVPEGSTESWQRQFGAHRFRSRLKRARLPHTIIEQFGLLQILLQIGSTAAGLSMRVIGTRIGGVPLPRMLWPWTVANESVDELGRFTFDVEIGLPLVGRLVRYHGWLEPAVKESGLCESTTRVTAQSTRATV